MSYSSNTGKYKKSDVYKFNVNDNSNYERTGFGNNGDRCPNRHAYRKCRY